jgi:predicted ATPase
VAQHSTNLPEPLNRLVGVERITRGVAAQFAHHRLVTLVGAGGIGKTCVAVATAGALREKCKDGVWFVDLTTASNQQSLHAAIGSVIHADAPVLLPSLSDKRVLLVLDGCDHVIEAAGAFVLNALRAAPFLNILATSREPLSVDGERVHHVQPLDVPIASATADAEQAKEYSAVQLFVARTADALGEFTLGDIELPTVIDICRKVEGLPLAIEMAAASVEALGLHGVSALLDHPLRLPAMRRRTAPLRHRTLRAALDWSYRSLADEGKMVLQRLSIFTGRFTIEGAVFVAADAAPTETQLVDRIVELVAKSLITADGDGMTASLRLRLSTTTRAYAFEKLEESGELVEIAQRHAALSDANGPLNVDTHCIISWGPTQSP